MIKREFSSLWRGGVIWLHSLPFENLSVLLLIVVVFVGFFALSPTAFATGDCNLFGGDAGRCIAGFSGKIIATILMFFTGVAGVILGWIGQLFEWAMIVTVFNFSYYFGNTNGMLLAWGILRDLANIALLFGFIFMGIAVILDLHSFPWKKTLPMLIIYAILLNFSLFAAEAIIDVSNSVSSVFYAQASGGTDCRDAESVAECANNGLAGKALEATGLAGMFSENTGSVSINTSYWGESFSRIWSADDGVMAATLFLGLFVFILITLAIIVSGSIMLISRAVTLMLLLVTSPIGFAGAAIPPLQSISKQWWEKLMDNVLFAPTFVLLMLIGFKIVEGIRDTFLGNGADGNLIRALLPEGGAASSINTGGVFVLFALVIGFMYAALTVAKRFGVYGSEKVIGAAESFVGRATGFGLTAVPAYAGRRTFGGMSERASRFIRRQGWNTIPVLGKTLTGVADYGAKASFDARGMGVFGDKLGKVGGLPGGFGKATKDGARGIAETESKDKIARAKAVDDARGSWKSWRKEVSNSMGRNIQNLKKSKIPGAKLVAGFFEWRKDFYDKKTKNAFRSGAQKQEIAKLEGTLSRLTGAIQRLEQIPGTNRTQRENDILAMLKQRQDKAAKDLVEINKTSFSQEYADNLANFGRSLWRIGYDMRGVKLAAIGIRKNLNKSDTDKLADQLKALADAANKK